MVRKEDIELLLRHDEGNNFRIVHAPDPQRRISAPFAVVVSKNRAPNSRWFVCRYLRGPEMVCFSGNSLWGWWHLLGVWAGGGAVRDAGQSGVEPVDGREAEKKVTVWGNNS